VPSRCRVSDPSTLVNRSRLGKPGKCHVCARARVHACVCTCEKEEKREKLSVYRNDDDKDNNDDDDDDVTKLNSLETSHSHVRHFRDTMHNLRCAIMRYCACNVQVIP